MQVQFKNNALMRYNVLEEGIEYDQQRERYCPCYQLIIGWVDKELLEPATSPDLVDATDVMVYLANIKQAT